MIKSSLHLYSDGSLELEGYYAFHSLNQPLLILCHAWRGRDDFIEEKARCFANLGFNSFALDMYGKGILGKNKEENASLKKPFIQDRLLLKNRVLKGYEKALSLVGNVPVAVLGYGFGGHVALDLARTDARLDGAITVYGHYDAPPFETKINTKVLIHHGYKDPVVPFAQLLEFQKTLTDFETVLYGNAYHAFATPSANDPQNGILYNEEAAHASLDSITTFLTRVLL